MTSPRSNMFPVCTIVLLSLVSVSHSAPLAGEELVRPLDQLDARHLEGRWALVAGSVSNSSFMVRFKERDSATINFSSNTNETNISVSRTMRSDNKCHNVSYNIFLGGSSYTFDNGRVNTTFIYTSCHDCILLSFDVESGKRQHLYLYSRRRQLEEEEMEEFRAQAGFLNMPPPAVMDPTKELCPEETAGNAAAQTEEKTEEQKD